MDAPEQLRITWTNGSEFLSAYDRVSGRYTVAVPHGARVLRRTNIGDQLFVEHRFADADRTFRHLARVIDHENGPPEILTLEFVDGRNAQLVVCHAEGQSVPYLNRRAARHPVWLPVELGPRSLHGIITELSELGAFIATKHPTPEGTIDLRLPASNPCLHLRGRVLYTRDIGETGFAVEFVFANREEEVHVQAALRRALQDANQRR